MVSTSRTKKPEPGLYIATTTGVIKVKGVIYRYIGGKTIIRDTDPLLRAAPASFRPFDIPGPEVVVS